MRVIAGTARGRRLAAPAGRGTRPTPDRVKEALFSILGDRIVGARVLDLFAGTGALGIEALSRGAAHATFVERERSTARVLRENLALLDPADTQVLVLDAAHAIRSLPPERGSFDLAFIDPPFESALWDPTLAELVLANVVTPGGIVVCEHPPTHGPSLTPNDWQQQPPRRYGDVWLTLYLAGNEETPS